MSTNIKKYEKDLDWISSTSRTLHTKFRISLSELVFLGSFVVNFVVGKMMHFFSQEEEVYNFYNNKKNFINQIFVKKGWAWTTLAVVVFYGCLLTKGDHPAVSNPQQRARAVGRALATYLAATVWWYLFTQWCFGLPLMDKIFVYTGGKCTGIAHPKLSKHIPSGDHSMFSLVQAGVDVATYETNKITSYTCRKLSGSWEGGHDPSGHVFLLVHSSLYLFFETLPYWSWDVTKRNSRALVTALRRPHGRPAAVWTYLRDTPHAPIGALVSLWWFMLLMTNIYFHSIAEKFVGLLFGYMAVVCIYYAPRWYHAARH